MASFSQEGRVQKGISHTLTHLSESMGIKIGGPLSNLAKDDMEKLLDIASEQHAALEDVRKLTGIKYVSVNINDIKNIDPEKYESSEEVAKPIDTVARLEAKKLLHTSDFISDVKKHLAEVSPEARKEIDSELKLARTIVGKAIKGCITIFDQFQGKLFSISHMPDSYLKTEVGPLRQKMAAILRAPEPST